MGNHLDRLAKELTATLFLDNVQVNLPSRIVRITSQRTVRESLVVSQVEIGLTSIVQNVNLTVLIGAHGAGVYVNVGIQLLHFDFEPTPFQQHTDRSTSQSLTE